MNGDTKTKLIGMICAGMDGRDPRNYILEMDGDECVWAHNVLSKLDSLLKAQWRLMGAPDDEVIL